MGDVIGGLITKRQGRRQVRTARPNAITLKKRQAFLDALALTCNVRKSAVFAGFDASSAHRLRREEPAFGVQWQVALEMGYDRLEALALEHSGAGETIESDPERAAEADPAPFDFDKAMKLLGFHRAARQGQRQTPRGGAALRNATREETTEALMKALAAAKRRIERARLRGE